MALSDNSQGSRAEDLRKEGYGVIPPEQYLSDMEDSFLEIWNRVKSFTLTSVERGYSLYKAVEYIIRNNIPGDFVECGVWKGGSCMLIALILLEFGEKERKIFLYDTYEGMTKPTEEDIIAWNGRSVMEKWNEDKAGAGNNFTSWSVGLETVRNNVFSTGYPEDGFIFVQGDVAGTLERTVPDAAALVRLDTDWYASTAVELKVLYPLLSDRGVLIIDDYGHFEGARKAVDEYFSNTPVFLSRIDYTGRIAVKTC